MPQTLSIADCTESRRDKAECDEEIVRSYSANSDNSRMKLMITIRTHHRITLHKLYSYVKHHLLFFVNFMQIFTSSKRSCNPFTVISIFCIYKGKLTLKVYCQCPYICKYIILLKYFIYFQTLPW
jgi:hypothetical protein